MTFSCMKSIGVIGLVNLVSTEHGPGIIVNFTSYRARQKLYKIRAALKDKS